jgi:putative DNA primase/helicase
MTGQPEQGGAPAAGDFTDLAAADRLAAANVDRLRHVRGVGWLAWDGRRWAPGEVEAHRAAKANANEWLQEAAGSGDAKQAAAGARLCGEPRIRGALALATSDERLSIKADELDTDLHLLNTHSGIVNLRDGTLSEHDPSLHMTKLAGAAYVPDARSERWDRFLARVAAGDVELIEYMQRAAGFAATGSTDEEVAFFAHGPGASGKTTMLEALRSSLGGYAAVADFATFLAGRSDGDGPTPGVARLAGARMVCSSEVSPGQRFNPARLKALTGGERIVARHLHREPFEFDPAFTLWLAANERPAIPADDDAAWRRLRLLPFVNVIPAHERDPALKRALTSDPDDRAAVLAWIVQGAIAWHREGLVTCLAVEQATAGYRGENDPIVEWFTARCQVLADAQASGRELRTDYETWCRQSGEEACSPHDFAHALEDHGCKRKRTKAGVVWTGVRVYPVQPVQDRTGTSHMRARMEENPQGPTPGTPGTPREAQA